jgi:hypothetical protein
MSVTVDAPRDSSALPKNPVESASRERESSGMVHVAFRRPDEDHDLLVLSVAHGQPVRALGNSAWLDFRFTPFSSELDGPVSFADDCEAWARSLPDAYAGTGLRVYLCGDPDLRRLNPSYVPPAPERIIADPIAESERAQREQTSGKPKRTLRIFGR